MKTMLLSFKTDVYERVLSGEKIYEHRKVFPNGRIKAYLYISRPIQAITGIMYLDNKTPIREWLVKYRYDKQAVKRIENYLISNNYAMEIQLFQETNRIYLSDIRNIFPNFVIPQMYYFLDDLPLLDYLEANIILTGKEVRHSYDNVSSEMICIH